MSTTVLISRNGTFEPLMVDTGTTGLDLFGDDRSIVAMSVNGTTVDLAALVGAVARLADQAPRLAGALFVGLDRRGEFLHRGGGLLVVGRLPAGARGDLACVVADVLGTLPGVQRRIPQ